MDAPLTNECPFCQRLTLGQLLFESPLVVAFRCKFPVSDGHVLVVPRRHVDNLLDLDSLELEAVWDMTRRVCDWADEHYGPDGFNIGANIGTSAGQTVPHANFHVIPRYEGDVEDPRGGIRSVKPLEAPYWEHRI